MCGIAGFYKNNKGITTSLAENILKKMTNSLSHRGPDHLNYWYSEEDDIFFSHSRLSILDLSSNGNQPMFSKSNRYVITFNGEIYNHLEIRNKINKKKKIIWKSSCDTETLIESIELYGVENTLNMIEGMFAFAIWDKKKKQLYLARDKFGQKPLYYGFLGDSIVFGSELKAITCYQNFSNHISKSALGFFLNYSYIQEPDTIYKNIFKVMPSELITFDFKNKNSNKKFLIKKDKWSYFLKPNIDNKQNKKVSYYVDKLDEILTNAVKETMLADVQVGCFLSGGIDSSLISAISQKISNKPISTFSIGFVEKEYDESSYAKKVSNHLGTDHSELIIDSQKLYSIFDQVIDVYDEPFADSSQIPTIILSKFARKKVKVVLTGDGADELFGGYNRYIYINKVYLFLKLIPRSLKNKLSYFLFSSNIIYKIVLKIAHVLSLSKYKIPQIKDKIDKFSKILRSSNSKMEIYFSLLKVNQDINKSFFQNSTNLDSYFTKEIKEILLNKKISDHDKMMTIDQNFYLNGDILHKVDRASMNVGLETRIPFLNSKVYEFAQNLPSDLKFNKGYGKWILRELSKKYIPSDIYLRKKMGFSIPLNKWIKINSKKIINNFQKNKQILIENGINVDNVNLYLKEHVDEKRDWSGYLWNIIIFERWLNKKTI